jgi:hypothetical protein
MKGYRWSRGTAPLIPNLGTIRRGVVDFILQPLQPQKRKPVPMEQKAAWVPNTGWAFWRIENLLGLQRFEPRTVWHVASGQFIFLDFN